MASWFPGLLSADSAGLLLFSLGTTCHLPLVQASRVRFQCSSPVLAAATEPFAKAAAVEDPSPPCAGSSDIPDIWLSSVACSCVTGVVVAVVVTEEEIRLMYWRYSSESSMPAMVSKKGSPVAQWGLATSEDDKAWIWACRGCSGDAGHGDPEASEIGMLWFSMYVRVYVVFLVGIFLKEGGLLIHDPSVLCVRLKLPVLWVALRV